MNNPAILQVVVAIRDHDLVERWTRWLLENHIPKVCSRGALNGEITRTVDSARGVFRITSRFRFKSIDALGAYDRDHAPALRKETDQAFPEGVEIISRTLETVIGTYPQGL